jgi:hypothetical protein
MLQYPRGLSSRLIRLVTWYQRRLGLGFSLNPALIHFFGRRRAVAVLPIAASILSAIAVPVLDPPPGDPAASCLPPGARGLPCSPPGAVRHPPPPGRIFPISAPSAAGQCAIRRRQGGSSPSQRRPPPGSAAWIRRLAVRARGVVGRAPAARAVRARGVRGQGSLCCQGQCARGRAPSAPGAVRQGQGSLCCQGQCARAANPLLPPEICTDRGSATSLLPGLWSQVSYSP